MPRRSRASPARPLPRDLGRNRGGLGARVPAAQAQLRRPGGFNDHEAPAFVELTREREFDVRFLEYMPFGRLNELQPEYVPGDETRDRIEAAGYRLEPLPWDGGPARSWRVPGFRGTVGFITAVSHHFCGSCDRLRLTADGFFVNCLYGEKRCDLKPLLRGAGPTRRSRAPSRRSWIGNGRPIRISPPALFRCWERCPRSAASRTLKTPRRPRRPVQEVPATTPGSVGAPDAVQGLQAWVTLDDLDFAARPLGATHHRFAQLDPLGHRRFAERARHRRRFEPEHPAVRALPPGVISVEALGQQQLIDLFEVERLDGRTQPGDCQPPALKRSITVSASRRLARLSVAHHPKRAFQDLVRAGVDRDVLLVDQLLANRGSEVLRSSPKTGSSPPRIT